MFFFGEGRFFVDRLFAGRRVNSSPRFDSGLCLREHSPDGRFVIAIGLSAVFAFTRVSCGQPVARNFS